MVIYLQISILIQVSIQLLLRLLLDFEHVISYLDEDKPSYILVRLDDKNSAGEYHWLFMSYVPDNAKIRDKMIYASTRATLTKGLGDGRFTDNLYGTVKVLSLQNI